MTVYTLSWESKKDLSEHLYLEPNSHFRQDSENVFLQLLKSTTTTKSNSSSVQTNPRQTAFPQAAFALA